MTRVVAGVFFASAIYSSSFVLRCDRIEKRGGCHGNIIPFGNAPRKIKGLRGWA